MKNRATEKLLTKMLEVIKKNPGIRPSLLNRILGVEHSWSFRKHLIKQGLIRKGRKGSAVFYFPNSPEGRENRARKK